ncbi:hypothetical protein BRD03_09315 [Halobacteriales archaeon QS_9_68_17]|nr:MAG: hypothetical protein BRD03_09315 [Halobacteriales archaeon QS_9_68_17]
MSETGHSVSVTWYFAGLALSAAVGFAAFVHVLAPLAVESGALVADDRTVTSARTGFDRPGFTPVLYGGIGTGVAAAVAYAWLYVNRPDLFDVGF